MCYSRLNRRICILINFISHNFHKKIECKFNDSRAMLVYIIMHTDRKSHKYKQSLNVNQHMSKL